MARKIARGKPLEEATKGSLEYTLRQIRNNFYRQHPDTENEIYWVEETFADHIIVNSDRLKPDEFYYVTYTREGGNYVFSPRDQWEIVELTYQPQTLDERLRAKPGKRLVEVSLDGVMLAEAQNGQPRVIHADGAMADVVNGNGRRYSTAVIIEAVADARHHLRESLSQGRAILLGEEEHPAHKETRRPRMLETIVAWQDIWFDAKTNTVKLRGNMVENSKGKDAIATMDAGILPGVSLRGYGESEFINENGRAIEDVKWLRFTGFDLVMEPSFEDAGVTALESRATNGESKMDPEEEKEEGKGKPAKGKPVQESTAVVPDATTLINEHPAVVEKILKHVEFQNKMEADARAAEERKLREAAEKLNKDQEAAVRAALGIDETADIITAVREASERRAALEAKERAAQVAEYIEKQTSSLNAYPDWMREKLRLAISKQEPETIEEAKAALVSQREVFDGMLAEMKLRGKGYGGLDVLGPVLESETGVPEFARGAFEIAEGLRGLGYGRRRQLHKKDVLLPSEVFAMQVLEKFDNLHRTKLAAESRMFAEAETTSDLNLPYSVTRAIMEEAYPDLVAANVFDFGVMNNSPDRIYYESQFAGESGYSNAVTGSNNVNAAAFDTWYTLAAGHKRLAFDGISMQPSGGGTPLVFGVDYLLDFEAGRYMLLSTGGMSTATNYDLDYTYYAVRKGEDATIERAKAQLAYVTLEAIADRLALQVTKEAIVFGRSQVGWDAAMNSINLLIKELRLLIERNLLHLSLSQALTVASNIAGTWNSGSDTTAALVGHILAAKTKVENRHYQVNSIIMSKTRGNSLILWDGFTASGTRPGFRLDGAPGLLGYLAEIPIFTSTEFPDGWIEVNHREIVQHRIYQPMTLEGPFPTYHTDGKMKANKEYYVEEFNGTVSPIPAKASVVRVV